MVPGGAGKSNKVHLVSRLLLHQLLQIALLYTPKCTHTHTNTYVFVFEENTGDRTAQRTIEDGNVRPHICSHNLGMNECKWYMKFQLVNRGRGSLKRLYLKGLS